MSSKESSFGTQVPAADPSRTVVLSPWVNQLFPAWDQLLSAHDVARLTRRPLWIVRSLTFLRRFPRKRSFHGRAVGWLRSDVLDWLAKDVQANPCHADAGRVSHRHISRPASLPLEDTGPPAANIRRVRTPATCGRHRYVRTKLYPPSAPSDALSSYSPSADPHLYE